MADQQVCVCVSEKENKECEYTMKACYLNHDSDKHLLFHIWGEKNL